MSSGAVADSGLIARVSFTCDAGTTANYQTNAGISLSTFNNINDSSKISTISSDFRLTNGLTVSLVAPSNSNSVGTGIFDENFNGFGVSSNAFVIDLKYLGQGAPPSGDTEQEIKDNYWHNVRYINHTAANSGLVTASFPASTWYLINPYGDPIDQSSVSGETDNHRVQFRRLLGSGFNNSSGDLLKWALNDEITVEFRGY
jgi:hypothetical protein